MNDEMQKLLADYDRDNWTILETMKSWLHPAEVKKSRLYKNRKFRKALREKLRKDDQSAKSKRR